ncbi:MAG: hypothetical protein ABWW65_07300 [Thermoprotei archaeon]
MSIQFNSINAEKLVASLPPKIEFSINLTLPSGEPVRRGTQYHLPFIFSVSTKPPVIQIMLKGIAIVMSSGDELDKLDKDVRARKIPSPIIQAILVNSIAESIILARSLGVPPPVPVPPQLGQQLMEQKKNKFGQESVI